MKTLGQRITLLLIIIGGAITTCQGWLPSCTPNPCINGGQCVTNSIRRGDRNQYYCRCPSSFIGERCEFRNPCETTSTRCQNGGTCVVQLTAVASLSLSQKKASPTAPFACKCPLGYTASLCEIPLPSACDSSPCQNGATCQLTTSLHNYTCLCSTGFRGPNCDLIDHCATASCLNGGTCTSDEDSYACHCPPGFRGPTCAEDVDECSDGVAVYSSNEASPQTACVHGTCANTIGSYTCTCEHGWTGTRCEAPFVPCSPDPCKNDGLCIQNLDTLTYTCRCQSGFTGVNCEINIDDCGGHICQNGGKCVDGVNSYSCECPPQYTGIYCSKDVDECSLRPNVCQNGATCVNTNGGYNCICVNGWTGKNCSENIDDCAENACLNGATCHDRVGSFHCECPPGKTGLMCHLNDACTSNPCHPYAICETSPVDGAYICNCPPGFEGVDCQTDINECEVAGSPCEHGGTCVNTPGSFKCDCTVGFTGPRCEININECDSSPCQNDGTCLDERGGYRCVCMPGYTGPQCEHNIDECESSPCRTGICTDLINGYRCLCPEGFTGPTCEQNEDDCYSNPCLNGGKCIDNVASFTCVCPRGFNGQTCEVNINDCASNPCHNGNCIDSINSFVCLCHPGYTGQLCETQINECISNPCLHGGTCRDHVNGFECICPKGTSGQRCEQNVNECWSNPCRNGATCHDKINSFACECAPGFTGVHCERDIDECASNPCANGGTCYDLVNGYKCLCPKGFYDARCLSDVSECFSSPCLNGGSCIDHLNSYSCSCLPGFGGINCQTNIDDCVPNRCMNGGTCIDMINGFTCICSEGYYGTDCSLQKERRIGSNATRVHEPTGLCSLYDCDRKSANKICDEECNTMQCSFDGGDCLLGFHKNPWKNCSRAAECWKVFGDGECNEFCNYKECLFDGFDCKDTFKESGSRKCNHLYDSYCLQNYANGVCDFGCNNVECGWDGLDCEGRLREDAKDAASAKGTLVITVDIPISILLGKTSTEVVVRKALLRELSIISGTVLRIKENEKGEMEIKPVLGENGARWSELVLVADNRRCFEDCFDNTLDIASFLAAAQTRKGIFNRPVTSGFNLKQVKAFDYDRRPEEKAPFEESSSSMLTVMLVLVGFLFAGVTLGVLISSNKKKVARGITWFPEGFFPSNHRDALSGPRVSTYQAAGGDFSRHRNRHRIGKPDGQEMRQINGGFTIPGEDEVRVNNNDNLKDTIYEEPIEPRSWTVQHYEAYGEGNATSVPQAALSPNSNGGLMTPPLTVAPGSSVDVMGPGGLTPLMVASAFRGATPYCGVQQEATPEGMEFNEVGDGKGQTSIIQELLMAGASINLTTEKTGETCLHLAARHARADAAKRLLDLGHDCNAVDSTGRTPLHAAIAADARGVFELLLRNRATNLNQKTNDGTTPLILAARLACEGMLSDLILAEADVNACDSAGKTALHWAASVNNVDAIRTLLAHGANKDAQDYKEETPLFLAAREGALQASRILLENGANRDITDHMDQLPRDVANARMHTDIVKLLDHFLPPAPPLNPTQVNGQGMVQTPLTPPSSMATSPLNTLHFQETQGKESQVERSTNVKRSASLRGSTLKRNKKAATQQQQQQPPPLPPPRQQQQPQYEYVLNGSPTVGQTQSPQSNFSTSLKQPPPSYDESVKQQTTTGLPPSSQEASHVYPQLQQSVSSPQQTQQRKTEKGGLLVDLASFECYLTPSPDSPFSTWSQNTSSPPMQDYFVEQNVYQSVSPPSSQPQRQVSSTQQAVFI